MHLRTLSVLGLSLIFASLTACGSNTTEEGNGGSGGSSNGGSNTGATGGSGTGATGGSGTGATGGSGTGATGGSGTGATGGSGTGATGGSGTGATGGSGTGATGGSTGGSGTGAVGGSGTGAVGGSGTGATGGSGGASACDVCLGANCSTELSDCNGNADCVAVYDCVNGGGDPQTCLDMYPNGADAALALNDCLTTNCSTDCGGGASTVDCEPSGETPSGGACGESLGDCNPVTGAGCAAGEGCDMGNDMLFHCFPPPNDVGICGSCDAANGPWCENGATCIDIAGDGNAQCARYCCSSDDCGPSGTCAAAFDGIQVGLCIVQ